jgi:hypothetical protein
LKQFDSPDGFQVDRDQKMTDIFSHGTAYNRSVVIDIDGTLLEYREGRREHRAPKFRPFYRTFVDGLNRFCNLFLFSSGTPTRSKNLFQKYFKNDFCWYFDRTLLHRKHKSLKAIDTGDHPLLIIDDSSDAIHPWSGHLHLPISCWTGDPDDTELLRVLQLVEKTWALK